MDWASIGVSPSLVGPGEANRGRDWRGAARRGKGCKQQRRGHRLPPLLFREQFWLGRARSGVVGRGRAELGRAWPGAMRQSHRRWHGGPTGLPCHPHGWFPHGSARRARVGRAWRGCVGQGGLRQGLRQQHGGLRLSLLLSLRVALARTGRPWRGEDGYVQVRPGDLRSGLVWADDLSTEPFGALCWVLWNPVTAGHGPAQRVSAWRAGAAHGELRCGKGCRQQYGASAEAPCCSHQGSGLCMAWHGELILGQFWCGVARQGKG